VQDNIAAAARQLGKLESTVGERKKSIIDKAEEELQEGAAALTDRQNQSGKLVIESGKI